MYDWPYPATVGQQVTTPNGASYVFDGTKWAGVPSGALAGTATPLMDGTAAVGVSPYYSRQDHVHPAVPNIGRNLLHNALFNVQQRTGPWTTNTYTLDRWVLGFANDADSVSVYTMTDADRAAIGDEAAVYGLQDVFTGSATANSFSVMTQRIESVRRTSNKTVMASVWAKATNGTPKLGMALQQCFGAGGSPSAYVNVQAGTTPALTTTWTRYGFPAVLPSVAGKTFGTTLGTDFLSLFFFFSDTSSQYTTGVGQQSGTVQLWGPQLEVLPAGAAQVATPLDKVDPRIDLSNCQRFFASFGQILVAGYGGAGIIYSDLTMPVTMRATPTIAYSSPTYQNASAMALNVAYPTDVRSQATTSGTGLSYAVAPMTASADL
jgi:hypothetical protein